MKLPIQSAPVYRYNTCTPGYPSIEEGVNPAINWGKLAKCAIKTGTLKEHVLCFSECGINSTCLADCMVKQLPDAQVTPWRVCVNS